ncbi:MAG: protein-glutamate O-methyltransferase CheR [Cytophagales bacterium]
MIDDIEISDIKTLCTEIHQRYNYDFSNYALSSFKRRVIRFIDLYKIPTTSVLIEKIKTDPTFFNKFLNELTVNVTEMFRDPSLWRELKEKVFPTLFATHENIKIWHAGCSSGEEVYSMCILLKENGWLDRAKIFATDIDNNILEKAKNPKYNVKTMHDINDKNYIRFEGKTALSDYYKIENGLAVMDTSLVKNVTYRTHDLVKSGAFNKFDIILCRNVLIYFNQQLQNEVFKLFHESMFNYSYFIIGSKESMIWCDVAHKFITVNQEEKIYRRVRD